MVDLICEDNNCKGIVVKDDKGRLNVIYADYTVLACGGIGGIYKFSTNCKHLTGDGVAVALRNGVKTEHIDYVQIHPTTFYTEEPQERSFLISESVRGEGALLYNSKIDAYNAELEIFPFITKGESFKQLVWPDKKITVKQSKKGPAIIVIGALTLILTMVIWIWIVLGAFLINRIKYGKKLK